MKCVVDLVDLFQQENGASFLRGRVYEGPLNTEGVWLLEVYSSRVRYPSICFFCQCYLNPSCFWCFFMVPFLNYSCNLAIEYMCEQIECVSVSGIFPLLCSFLAQKSRCFWKAETPLFLVGKLVEQTKYAEAAILLEQYTQVISSPSCLWPVTPSICQSDTPSMFPLFSCSTCDSMHADSKTFSAMGPLGEGRAGLGDAMSRVTINAVSLSFSTCKASHALIQKMFQLCFVSGSWNMRTGIRKTEFQSDFPLVWEK